jgi:hypothetical protein
VSCGNSGITFPWFVFYVRFLTLHGLILREQLRLLAFISPKNYAHNMSSQELVSTLDFILNRCNERDIEAVAAAVVRRRRDIALFSSIPGAPGSFAKGQGSIMDPKRMAEELSSQLNMEGTIEGLKNSVRDFAFRMIKQEAPNLTDDQIDDLAEAWIPDRKKASRDSGNTLPQSALAAMVDQFVSFSLGNMEDEEDQALRREMGPWPDKYWKAFPQVVRLLLSDYLKGQITEKEYKTRLGLALRLG